MLRPNFIILGAPKCATSSLFDWLSAHPDIRASRKKETFALMDRGHPLMGLRNIHDHGAGAFASYFDPADGTAAIRMEATTHTLFQTTALDAAAKWADLRVALVLREPAERVVSSFRFTQQSLGRVRRGVTFADYLDAVRRNAPLFPHLITDERSAFVLSRDVSYSRYARWLAPWIDTLGHRRVRPILFDDLKRDPAAAVAGLVDWLGLAPLPPTGVTHAARNETVTLRAPRLQRTARAVNAVLPIPAVMKHAYAALQRKSPAPITPEDAAALAELKESYGEDNRRLAHLIGRDLSGWARAVEAAR